MIRNLSWIFVAVLAMIFVLHMTMSKESYDQIRQVLSIVSWISVGGAIVTYIWQKTSKK